MVKSLHRANVNILWEHGLSDNKNYRKKPTPKDPMYKITFYSINIYFLVFVIVY